MIANHYHEVMNVPDKLLCIRQRLSSSHSVAGENETRGGSGGAEAGQTESGFPNHAEPQGTGMPHPSVSAAVTPMETDPPITTPGEYCCMVGR